MEPVRPPKGVSFEPDEQDLWDEFIADNPYLDQLDGWMASMWCREAARYNKDPRGMTAADKSQMLKMANDLYLSAAERNRKAAGEGGGSAKRGAASKFLSKRRD